MKKQIEEMAVILTDGGCADCTECSYNDRFNCKPMYDAELLYEAGYRKQSEARWKGAWLGDYYCSLCNATYSGGNEYNFCPNCGARMMKGDEGK
jgi:rubrerythrin